MTEKDAIAGAVQHYIDGAKSGSMALVLEGVTMHRKTCRLASSSKNW